MKHSTKELLVAIVAVIAGGIGLSLFALNYPRPLGVGTIIAFVICIAVLGWCMYKMEKLVYSEGEVRKENSKKDSQDGSDKKLPQLRNFLRKVQQAFCKHNYELAEPMDWPVFEEGTSYNLIRKHACSHCGHEAYLGTGWILG